MYSCQSPKIVSGKCRKYKSYTLRNVPSIRHIDRLSEAESIDVVASGCPLGHG